MRYINRLFTYLLTYLQSEKGCAGTASLKTISGTASSFAYDRQDITVIYARVCQSLRKSHVAVRALCREHHVFRWLTDVVAGSRRQRRRWWTPWPAPVK